MGVPGPLLGRKIAGKVVLESLIGAGAMGAVYKARHLLLDTVVAVKVMHDEMAKDGTFVERFQREARAASHLDHPNLIRVVDFGMEPDGLLYTVMDYVDGLDLFQTMQRDWPMSPERIVELLSQTLGAIAVAHDVGIVHRDLKPENIMVSTRVDDEGRRLDAVKVCDFGIAQITESRAPGTESGRALTCRGSLLGTPQYMSPEQCRGDALDAGSDLYSVGVILYQLLAGCLPFQAENPIDVVVMQISIEPTPPTELNPRAPPGLEAVCLKALRKNRAERYATAREMRASLREAIGGTAHDAALPPDAEARRIGAHAATQRAFSASLPLRSALPTMPSVRHPPSVPEEAPADVLPKRRARRRFVSAVVLGLAVGGAAVFVGRGRGTAPPEPQPQERTESMNTPAAHAETVVPGTAPGVVEEPHPVAVEELISPTLTRKSVPPRRASTDALPARSEDAPTAGRQEIKPASHTEPELPPAHASLPAPAPVPAGAVVRPPSSPSATPRVDPDKARVAWGVAAVGGGATLGGVSRALSRAASAWTGCYQAGLRARTRSIEGTAQLHLACDEEGRVVSATLSGIAMPDVAQCVRSASMGLSIPNADTGEAWATVALTFQVAK